MYQIKVNEVSSEIIQKFLFKNGFEWIDKTDEVFVRVGHVYLVGICLSNKTFGHSERARGADEVVNFNRLCELVTKPQLKIAGHDVTLHTNHIQVGCEKVTFQEIKALNMWLKSKGKHTYVACD